MPSKKAPYYRQKGSQAARQGGRQAGARSFDITGVPPDVKRMILNDSPQREIGLPYDVRHSGPDARFVCSICLRPRKHVELRWVYSRKKWVCWDVASCQREALANAVVDAEIERESRVASARSQAQTSSVRTGRTSEGGPAMAKTQWPVGPNPSYSPTHARELLAQGTNMKDLRYLTGFGVGTLQKIKADPNYAPNPKISIIRRKQWQDGTRKPRPANGAKVEEAKPVEPTLVTGSEALSLKNAVLAVLYESDADTVGEILQRLVKEGRSSDHHNITHVLHSLKAAQFVKFKTTTRNVGNGEKFPYDIQITGQGSVYISKLRAQRRNEIAPQPAQEAPQRVEEPVVAPTPTPAPIAQPAPEPREILPPQVLPADAYPLMRTLILRPAKVMAAAKLLREAGLETEAALVEGSVAELSALEKEVVTYFRHRNLERD